jgi:phosphohistidine phosphatase
MGHDEGMESSERVPVRYLWLLRHGKAASDAPWGGSDRDRPLTGRGRRDAGALGKRLAGGEPVLGLEGVPRPQLVICSSAVRTHQTAALVEEAMGDELPLYSYDALYGAETDVVLQYIREIDEDAKSVLLVGHNPTVYQLAWELLTDRHGDRARTDRATLESHGFPTCALAVLAMEVSAWEDAADECATLRGVFKPPY